jgi:outer membrane protein assembly factor BamB
MTTPWQGFAMVITRKLCLALVGALLCGAAISSLRAQAPRQPSARQDSGVGTEDWGQFGGSPHRNHALHGPSLPTDWDPDTGRNIKWSAPLKWRTFGQPVIANGKVYISTNNPDDKRHKVWGSEMGPSGLLCLNESDGKLLWSYFPSRQHPDAHRYYDCQTSCINLTPIVEGDRVWFVTNLGQIVCLDTEGFRDGENDGPFTTEKPAGETKVWNEESQADVVWTLDMRAELGVRSYQGGSCSPTIWGDVLFVCTSTGAGSADQPLPTPEAPSFLAIDKQTGRILWSDDSPGFQILNRQWSSPAVGVFDNVPQVIFAGGDGWIYSFRADRWEAGHPLLLWKFDANPKSARYTLEDLDVSTRRPIVATPVIHDGRVYVAVGDDIDHLRGSGNGHLWCIDPTRRGDVSLQLVQDEEGHPLPPQRLQADASPVELFHLNAAELEQLGRRTLADSLKARLTRVGLTIPDDRQLEPQADGTTWLLPIQFHGRQQRVILTAPSEPEPGTFLPATASLDIKTFVVPNPNSAVVWHYIGEDRNHNGKLEFDETMHQCVGSPALKDGLLFLTDSNGLVHCLDAQTGKPHWTCDLLSVSTGGPLIVHDQVYVATWDGDISIFGLSSDVHQATRLVKLPEAPALRRAPLREIKMHTNVCPSPVAAHGVLYIATSKRLYAIAEKSTD